MVSSGSFLFLVMSDKETGVGAVAMQHAKILQEAGEKVYFCAWSGGSLEAAARAQGFWYPHPLHLPSRLSPLAFLRDLFFLRRFAKDVAADLLLILTYRSCEHAEATLALGSQKPVIRFLPYSAEDLASLPFPRRLLLRWLLRSQRTRMLLTPDPASLSLLEEIRGCDPSRRSREKTEGERREEKDCVWLPGGVDTERFHPGIDGGPVRQELGFSKEDILIVFPARLKWGRGHYRFLDAFRRAWLQEPRLGTLCLGEGEEGEKIQERARQYGIANRIRFFAAGPRFVEAMAAADLGFLFHPGSAGTARGALELMALGKPLVASNHGVLRALKEGDGLEPSPVLPSPSETPLFFGDRVEPDEANRIYANAFLCLAKNPDLRHRLGERARRVIVERYSRERLANQLTALVAALRTFPFSIAPCQAEKGGRCGR